MRDVNSKQRILVVDDQVLNRSILRHVLEKDYDIIEAETGYRALECLGQEKIDIMLLDIVMPDMDGYGVLERKRAMGREIADIPVIIVTADDSAEALNRCMDMGAKEVLVTPIRPVLIRQRIAHILGARRSEAYRRLAEHDILTGVYNWQAMQRKLPEFLREHPGEDLDLICLNIKRFGLLCDLFGRERMDNVLCVIAEELFSYGMAEANVPCLFGRLVGDHFALCLRRQKGRPEELLARIRERVYAQSKDIVLDIVLGVLELDDRSLNTDTMYAMVNYAADIANSNVGGGVNYFSAEDRKEFLEQREMVDDFDAALAAKQFKIRYQPIFQLDTKLIVGAEAVVEWEHPRLGTLSASRFTSALETGGKLLTLNRACFREVCTFIGSELKAGHTMVPIGFNIFSTDAYNPRLCEEMLAFMEEQGVPVPYLRLEMDESVFSKDNYQVISTISILQQHGFLVGIDGIGKGDTSLTLLNEISFDVIKIDIAELQRKNALNKADKLLEFLVQLGQKMNIITVVHNVKSTNELEMLKEFGCKCVQGFFLAPPLEPQEFCHRITEGYYLVERVNVGAEENEAFANSIWRNDSTVSRLLTTVTGPIALLEWHDGRLRLLRANDHTRELFGERALKTLFEAEDVTKFFSQRQGFAEEVAKNAMGRAGFMAETMVHMEGVDKWLRIYFKPIHEVGDFQLFLAFIRDKTDEREREFNEDANKKRLQMILAETNIYTWEFDFDTKKFTGRSAVLPFDYNAVSMDDLLNNLTANEIVQSEDLPRIREFLNHVVAGETSEPLTLRLRSMKAGGGLRWFTLKYSIVEDVYGRPTKVVGLETDITERISLEEKYANELNFKHEAMQNSHAFYEVDLDEDRLKLTNIKLLNELKDHDKTSFRDVMTEQIERRVHKNYWNDLWELFDRGSLLEKYADGVRETSIEYLRSSDKHKGFQWYRLRLTLSENPVNGHITLFGIVRNIHEAKLLQVRTRYAAERDFLTGAYNRRYFEKIVRQLLKNMGPNDDGCFAIVDMDNFKKCNDTYGHQAGDMVLRRLTHHLARVFRGNDYICRLGGDEFAVFAPGLGDKSVIEEKFTSLCKYMEEDEKLPKGGLTTCSMGVAMLPMHGSSFDELYFHADRSLYTMKDGGRNGYCVYGEKPRRLADMK